MAAWRRKYCTILLAIFVTVFILFFFTSYEKISGQSVITQHPLETDYILELHDEVISQSSLDWKSSSIPPTSVGTEVNNPNTAEAGNWREKCKLIKRAVENKAVIESWRKTGNVPPNPVVTLENYQESQTIKELDRCLLGSGSRLQKGDFVVLVVANKLYMNVTLNWLCVLRKNVPHLYKHVLVVNLDEDFHSLLQKMETRSVYANTSELLDLTLLNCGKSRFADIWMLRLLIIHHLIHMGVDVVVMDTDALILKDPMYLFTVISNVNKADVIFGKGKYPYDLGAAWGYTACMGTSYFKSSPGTKLLLSEMSKIDPFITDDQVRLNLALNQTGIHWPTHSTKGTLDSITGRTSDDSLRIALLPEEKVCRYRCKMPFFTRKCVAMDQVYIAHPLLLKGKKRTSLKLMGFWPLREENLIHAADSPLNWFEEMC